MDASSASPSIQPRDLNHASNPDTSRRIMRCGTDIFRMARRGESWSTVLRVKYGLWGTVMLEGGVKQRQGNDTSQLAPVHRDPVFGIRTVGPAKAHEHSSSPHIREKAPARLMQKNNTRRDVGHVRWVPKRRTCACVIPMGPAGERSKGEKRTSVHTQYTVHIPNLNI
jgi:hypothetical protein